MAVRYGVHAFCFCLHVYICMCSNTNLASQHTAAHWSIWAFCSKIIPH